MDGSRGQCSESVAWRPTACQPGAERWNYTDTFIFCPHCFTLPSACWSYNGARRLTPSLLNPPFCFFLFNSGGRHSCVRAKPVQLLCWPARRFCGRSWADSAQPIQSWRGRRLHCRPRPTRRGRLGRRRGRGSRARRLHCRLHWAHRRRLGGRSGRSTRPSSRSAWPGS